MLLLEFDGELFQFDEREPQFAPLSQLPPKITALIPMLPSAFTVSRNPFVEHPANTGHAHERLIELVWCQRLYIRFHHKAQPVPQIR